MDEYLRRHLREVAGTHSAAVQAVTAHLDTSAVRMALDSYPSLSAMAGISEKIAALTHHHADALKQIRLTADRMSLSNVMAGIDIGRRMQDAMSAHTSAISMAGIAHDRDWFEQASSWRGAMEKVRANLTFPVDDWSERANSRTVSDLSAAGAVAHAALARIGINDLADVFANSGVGRYSDVLDNLTSSLKGVRTQSDFERIARAAFQQADEVTVEALEDDTASDGETVSLWNRLTPYQRLEIRYVIIVFILSSALTTLLWAIDRYFPVDKESPLHSPAQAIKQPYESNASMRLFVVRGDSVNVRSGPGPKYARIHSVSRGDIVRKLKQRRAWCQIEHTVGDGAVIRGWVKCKYLRNVELMVSDIASSIFNDLRNATA